MGRNIAPALCAIVFYAGASLAADDSTYICRDKEGTPLIGRWVLIQPSAEFTPRDVSHPFEFRGSLWLSNGYRDSKTVARDLWQSADGSEWTQVVTQTPYDPYSGVTVFKEAIYAVKNSVWRSTDGKHWEKLRTRGPFEDPDALPFARVLNGRLFAIWGRTVYTSKDGKSWRREPPPPFGQRTRFAIVSTGSAIYVMGGAILRPNNRKIATDFYPGWTSYNDVWRTTDGRTWKRLTKNAQWSARMWPSAVSLHGKLVLIGGFDQMGPRNLGDTWLSTDGVTWCQLQSPGLLARHWPSLFPRGDHILLTAGNAWPVKNDVWRLTLPAAGFSQKH